MKINKFTFTEQQIGKIKENIFYLNQLIENVQDPVIEFEIRKKIKYELSLLKHIVKINKKLDEILELLNKKGEENNENK